jgi:copper transporter 1
MPCSAPTSTQTRLALSVLFGVNVTVSYLLMLAIMTYNAGYFVVIVLGLSAGHFLFFTPDSPGAAPDVCCPGGQPA